MARSFGWVCSLVVALMSKQAAADPPRLALPLDCELGKTCYIQDYVDRDPTEGRQRDYTCGVNSRDGHKGTDFALLSFDALEAGVNVLASAPGTVLRLRDSMPDDRLMRGVTNTNACGNAVLIDHGDGWTGLYCHLKLGSVRVVPGERVETGQVLGEVGLSGQTNYPHIHLTIRHNGNLVDPFQTGDMQRCDAGGESLWTDTPPYYKSGLLTAGFSDHVPSLGDVRSGAARRDTATPNTALVVYTHIGYGRDGDVLTLSARGPDGESFRRAFVLSDPKISHMQAFGRKAPPDGWPPGDYLGEALLTRGDTVLSHRFSHVTVQAQ